MAPVATWATESNDAVTKVMASNYHFQSLADRFKGLGSALLSRFESSSSNFSQSVQVTIPGSPAPLGQATRGAQADVTLTILTKSGTKVELALHSQMDHLLVSVKSSAPLTDAERSALAQLSDAFQDTLDGLSAMPPTLELGGLMKFDKSVLSSVDLSSDVTGEGRTIKSISFHADESARSVSANGNVGTLKVGVDLRNSAIWGDTSQRAGAIANYLNQFDKAGSRGRVDDALMSLFKDAFTQMNDDYGVSSKLLPGTTYAPALGKAGHAMLTGLADFDVSIATTAVASNPRRWNEVDVFSYQASQSTSMHGNAMNGSISQKQQSSLNASYHSPLSGRGMLMLTSEKNSQNYYYTQIDDTAESTVDIENKDGRLVNASLSQSASQSTRRMKYDMGNLVSDITTPAQQAGAQNLLALLKPFFEDGQAARDSSEWTRMLSDLHGKILLQPDPSRLDAPAGNS